MDLTFVSCPSFPISSAESIITCSKFLQLFSLTLCYFLLHSHTAPPNTLHLLLMSPNRDNDYKVIFLYKWNLEGLSVVHSISIAGVSVLVVFPTSEERANVIFTEAKTLLWSSIDFFPFPFWSFARLHKSMSLVQRLFGLRDNRGSRTSRAQWEVRASGGEWWLW